jgi:hypothetical protein
MKLSFLLKLLILAGCTIAGFHFVMPLLPSILRHSGYIYIVLFFTVATALIHSGLEKSAKTGSKYFVRFYMMSTGIKLLLYIMIIVFYALIDKSSVRAFAFCFLITYFIFTAFETMHSYRQFGNMKNQKTSAEETQQ